MPNWCSNTLKITADPATLQPITELIGDGEGLLNRIDPLPDNLPEDDPEGARWNGGKVHNEWRSEHWGTKWDVVDPHVEAREWEVTCYFRTAWAPAHEAIERLSALYPAAAISLKYHECGGNFKGQLDYRAGEVVEYEHDRCDCLAEEMGATP